MEQLNKNSLFIWNDRRWKLIDKNAEYDKINYFVVRKLFVRWLKSSDTTSINTSIAKAFEKFGEIESVDDANDLTESDVHEAYVTFVNSVDAYKAFISNRSDKKSSEEIITVLPIDTWKIAEKPVELPEIFRRMSKIEEDDEPQRILKVDITSGALLRIFEACLRKLNCVIDGMDIYFQLDESLYESSEDLSVAAGDLPLSQKTDKKDSDAESDSDSDTELNSIENDEFEKRVAEVWVKHLCSRFETLSLRKFFMTMELIQWISPVLKQCKKLLIDVKSDCNILYALHEFCPNVKSFHLDGDEWRGDFEHIPAEPWPSLTELFLNIASCTNELQSKFRLFIAMNPQLTVLQMESVVDVDTLAVIGQSLINLNTLSFVREDFKQLHRVADNLITLTELRGIKITALEVEKQHLNKLSKCSKRLSQMHHLLLSTIFLNLIPDSDDYEDFRHLSEFCIVHHHNCKCHGKNRVLSFEEKFVRVPYDSSVLVLIINTKPPASSKDKSLEASIQREFDKTAKFFPNVIGTIVLQEENNWIYIHISSNRA